MNIAVFGEVLFDCFPDKRKVLGGAPFNVAWGLRGFGHAPLLISAVGRDAEGGAIRSAMAGWGMRTDGVQTDDRHPSGRVEVRLEAGDAVYAIPEPQAWDAIRPPATRATDVLYHGTLALRHPSSRRAFDALRVQSPAPRFYDVNLRPPHTPIERVRDLVRGAGWLKCNAEELAEIAGRTLAHEADLLAAAREVREAGEVGHLFVTAGGEGAYAVWGGGETHAAPPEAPGAFVDTVGAGDAFSAALIDGFLRGEDPASALHAAVRFARKVCTLRGATTSHPDFYTRSET